MIFISTSSVKERNIKDVIKLLYNFGFQNIELSGGTDFYPELEQDVLKLKEKYNLNYLLHNYFPPPREPFVINLASLNNTIFQMSLDHLKRAINLTQRMGINKFGLHAGFFIDIPKNQIGKALVYQDIVDREKAIERFCEGYNILKKETGNIDLFIENNVLSYLNYINFKKTNPLMLTTYEDYKQLKKKIDFNLLLDIGHLKVSTRSLGLDFITELKNLLKDCTYVHISDNNGKEDQNKNLKKNNQILEILKNNNFRNKTITLEIQDTLENIKQCQLLLNNHL